MLGSCFLGIHMGKSEKRKKLYMGSLIGTQNIENFEMFYPILFLKTDIFAQLDIFKKILLLN